MCDCVNIKVGSYDNTIILGYYFCMQEYADNRRKKGLSPYGIVVDRCIVDEIVSLWEKGIRTLGSCCGHNTVPAIIGVYPEDFKKVIAMGYEKYTYENEPERNDTIHAQSV